MSFWTAECERYEEAGLELHHAQAELAILRQHAKELGWRRPVTSDRQETALQNLLAARLALTSSRKV